MYRLEMTQKKRVVIGVLTNPADSFIKGGSIRLYIVIAIPDNLMGKPMTLKQFDPKHHSFKSKLKKGDEVVVLTGKSRGETAKIESIDKKKNRVYLEGKNLGKRHQKPDLNNTEGGIVDVPMPLHISNVALADPKGGKATRLGVKVDGGKKTRVAKKSGASV